VAEGLDQAIRRTDGRAMTVTGTRRADGGDGRDLWVKDETGSVAGSHKARHLIGVMLYLLVAEQLRLPAAEGLRRRRLAIASCGNAALAAAVVARAADWPLDVFLPPDADRAVTGRLRDLGAVLHTCPRQPGERGDPCAHAFRAAVAAGALPFSVQGCENGLAVEGAKTLVWELLDTVEASGQSLDALFVQVGGGALASACWQGLAEALAAGRIRHLPRLFAVQAEGCHPLRIAWERFRAAFIATGVPIDTALARAAARRSSFMVPWPETPRSAASGILDDETYDWLAVVEGVARTGGDVLVVTEDGLLEANRRAAAFGVNASVTGSAGLAGWLRSPAPGPAAVLLTGVRQ